MPDTPSPLRQTPPVPLIGLALAVCGLGGAGALYVGQSPVVAAGVAAGLLLFGWLCWQGGVRHVLLTARVPSVESNGLPTSDTGQAAGIATRFARAAIEATPNPVIIIDQGGRIVTTNQAARARFSINNLAVRFNNAVRRPDIIEAVEGVLADREPRTLALETRVPVDRYERLSVAAFETDGRTFVLLSVQDETEARMSERMRADFLANASHELRTPLAAIIGFIETLRGPARDDADARERFLAVMHSQADRMSRLISDLLSLSRIELNEHVPPTGQTNLSSAVYEAVDGLNPEKKKRIKLAVPKEPLMVVGDRDEMAQVVINLLDNALKYSRPDSVVAVSTHAALPRDTAIQTAMRQWPLAARLPLTSPPVDQDRLYGVLRVEDQGDGIAAQHLPRLAERFYRVEITASGKSGTGLGLAIVKHIVNRHRGGLVVESQPAHGTAFSVYLPQPED